MKHSETNRKIERCRDKILPFAVLCICVIIGLCGCGKAHLTSESTPAWHEAAVLYNKTALPDAGGEKQLRQEKSNPASTQRLNADVIRYLGAFRLLHYLAEVNIPANAADIFRRGLSNRFEQVR
jgi:hypothetical protein